MNMILDSKYIRLLFDLTTNTIYHKTENPKLYYNNESKQG